MKLRGRQWWLWLIIMLLVGGGLFLFTKHDAWLYSRPVAVVTQVETTSRQRQRDQFKNTDYLVDQRLKVRLLNTSHRGQTLVVRNHYTVSETMSLHYRRGNQVFLSQLHSKKGRLSAMVSGLKRDMVMVMLVWLVVVMLVLMMGHASLRAFASLVANTALFILAINLDLKWQGRGVLLLFSLLAVAFTVISLLLIMGPTRKMLAALLATVVATTVAVTLSWLLIVLTHERGLYFESMMYVTQVQRPLFIAETILGSLGAVMDVSSDIVATLFEVKRLQPTVSRRQLMAAGRRVGQQVMGPLTNVLMLIFAAEMLTSSVLFLRNGNSWGYTFSMTMSLGITQSLVCGIGIILAIPLTSWLMAVMIGKGDQLNEHD